MSIAIERRERTAAEIARDCRQARLVDWWVSAWHENPHLRGTAYLDPRQWKAPRWAKVACQLVGQRRTDPMPDAELRAAVIAEIDAIGAALERRRSA